MPTIIGVSCCGHPNFSLEVIVITYARRLYFHLCLFVCLLVCLSVCLFVWLSVRLSTGYLKNSLFIIIYYHYHYRKFTLYRDFPIYPTFRYARILLDRVILCLLKTFDWDKPYFCWYIITIFTGLRSYKGVTS